MSASNKTLDEDTVKTNAWPEPVYCQGCNWHGTMGQLLISEFHDNDMLYCPQCKWLGWVFA